MPKKTKEDIYKSELKDKQHKDMTIWQVLKKFKHYYNINLKYFDKCETNYNTISKARKKGKSNIA